MKELIVLGMMGMLCISSALAVNCGPVQDPCSTNPTKTVTWICPDGSTCGSAVCVEYCDRAYGFQCNGNNGYAKIKFPMGTCITQG
jgi:hypothetical protein